ncbi:ABC transporter ATP-binding protein [Nocardiopsis sp. N85]|uniref:ABC transporter ATP-binding protein n=1 Tax=Nocardiopsis sp. N85 TaxID=3029400 RepID=UPI00237EFAE7|nr:ABC transporter ATP-binding protein [Nocardiopsis sp. N85]MDE3724801.1 ABC transporter ATP-binding protein [Nocardiopsis sp. N85]
MSETVIEVTGLVKEYGGHRAVAGVDLSVPEGEIFSLLGPNGAGKSTTIEILEGFRRRDGGVVRVLGVDPEKADRSWRTRIGIVWQGETLLPKVPVREVVRHFAGHHPRPRDSDAVLELVGLTEKARALPESLSGGQRRRLDVALGIIGGPELLFLDEPTTGFDPKARRDFWELIRNLAREGTTVVLTTHYLEEAEALADRVCVLAEGRVRALDSPATLGGRATAQATVHWSQDGVRREIRTDEPTRVITELAAVHPGEIPELRVHRPTLEDVYLELIGDAEGTGTRTEQPEAVA